MSRRRSGPLVLGPVVAWRSWALTGHGTELRLRPVAGSRRPWPPRRPAEARCGHLRFHRAPAIGCTCGLYATREPELLRRTRGPVVIATVALWGTVVEHPLGYRARFGYPERLRLVCAICFWRLGFDGSREPTEVVTPSGGRRMPLCEAHLETARAAELPIRGLSPAAEVLSTLLHVYGVRELPIPWIHQPSVGVSEGWSVA